jgi:hypothetical protein
MDLSTSSMELASGMKVVIRLRSRSIIKTIAQIIFHFNPNSSLEYDGLHMDRVQPADDVLLKTIPDRKWQQMGLATHSSSPSQPTIHSTDDYKLDRFCLVKIEWRKHKHINCISTNFNM